MSMLKLDENLQNHLSKVSKRLGLSEAECIDEALREFFSEYRDRELAIAQIRKKQPRLSFNEIVEQLDLVN